MKKIEIEVSDKNEATRAPYWIILDPQQNMGLSIHMLAGQISGLFFSREEAERYLNATRYNFSARACVYCCSGHHGRQYNDACDKARIGYEIPDPKGP